MKYRVFEYIYQTLQRLSAWLDNFSQRFAICPDCGRNRYSGEPCK